MKETKSIYSYKNIWKLTVAINVVLWALMLLFILVFDKNAGLSTYFDVMLFSPKVVSGILFFPIAIVLIFVIISDLVLLFKEGFYLRNVFGIALSVLVIAAAVILFSVKVIPTFIFAWFCYFECVLISIVVMGYIAATRKPAFDKDYIIIPGCAISKKGSLLPLLKGRTHKAIRFAWDQEIANGKPVKYVPSGGQGPNEVMSEGSAIELYLLSHGAESYEVMPEKDSANTYENFLKSKALIDSVNPDAKIAFSTTNYHVLRSGLIAHDLGFEAEGIGSSCPWYFWPNGFVREFIAIVNMRRRQHIIIAAVIAAVFIAMQYIF